MQNVSFARPNPALLRKPVVSAPTQGSSDAPRALKSKPVQAQAAEPSKLAKGAAVVAGSVGGGIAGALVGGYGSMAIGSMIGMGGGFMLLGIASVATVGLGVAGLAAGGWAASKLFDGK